MRASTNADTYVNPQPALNDISTACIAVYQENIPTGSRTFTIDSISVHYAAFDILAFIVCIPGDIKALFRHSFVDLERKQVYRTN